jgi:hypothetical protein
MCAHRSVRVRGWNSESAGSLEATRIAEDPRRSAGRNVAARVSSRLQIGFFNQGGSDEKNHSQPFDCHPCNRHCGHNFGEYGAIERL